MKNAFILSLGSLLVALTSCSSGGNSVTPLPDQSQVMFVHSSYPQATTTLQFTADNAAVGQVGYGQGSGYILLTAGSHSLAATALASSTATLVKDQSYSLFAYSTSAAGTPSSLLVNDDLTAPTVGQARLRLINLAANVVGGDLKVAQAITTPTGTTYKDLTYIVSSNSFSGFTDFTPATTSLVVLDANNNVLAQVGNGGGGGTGVLKYQSGKLYTIIAAGDKNATSTASQLKAFVLNNN
ncbi:MAG: DUF4397 domain-containing protein [Janthinobacterium lividum]